VQASGRLSPMQQGKNAALIEAMSMSPGNELRRGSRPSLGVKRSQHQLHPCSHRTAGTTMVAHSLSADLMRIKATLQALGVRVCALADAGLPAAEHLRYMFEWEHCAPLLARCSAGRVCRCTSLAHSHVGLARFAHLALLLSQWREGAVPVLVGCGNAASIGLFHRAGKSASRWALIGRGLDSMNAVTS